MFWKPTISQYLSLTTGLLVAGAMLCLSLLFYTHIRQDIQSVLNEKSVEVGSPIAAMVIKAVGYGIPFDALRGLDRISSETQKNHPEIDYLEITNASGDFIFKSNLENNEIFSDDLSLSPHDVIFTAELPHHFVTVFPLSGSSGIFGYLHLGIDKDYVRETFTSLFYDQLTIVLVTILIILELSGFLLRHQLGNPLFAFIALLKDGSVGRLALSANERGGSLFRSLFDKLFTFHARIEKSLSLFPGKLKSLNETGVQFITYVLPAKNKLYFVRPPLYMSVFANALSMAFLPAYIVQLMHGAPTYLGLSRHVAIGLPISICMLCWAISQPLTGNISKRIGQKKTFTLGCCTLAVGLLGSGLALNLTLLIIAQGIIGFGYGLVFITGTSFVIAHTDIDNRAQGMASFLTAFFSGTLCGAAIGGILADQIGFRFVFFLGSCTALCAALFIYFLMYGDEPERNGTPTAVSVAHKSQGTKSQGVQILFKNIRFLILTLMIAVPSKMCLTGLMNYMTPLYLVEQGASQSLVGRVLMSYGLIMIVFAPLCAKLADRLGNRTSFVLFGSALAGIGISTTFIFPGIAGALLAISLLALAHAMSVSATLALIPELCADEIENVGAPAVMGIFRLIERTGSIAGPILAGMLITTYSFEGAYLGMGVITVAGSFGFALLMIWRRIFSKQVHYG